MLGLVVPYVCILYYEYYIINKLGIDVSYFEKEKACKIKLV